ncbi:MAG: hypothetical protein EBS62_06850 [Betaproteobacteria bacterium]|jgi:hypothetical protein|nr:hypothetical protein [Betaproteobacteria bacterium]NDG06103.1 hypothetical protein [Oxalobacteraceae bacterium]
MGWQTRELIEQFVAAMALQRQALLDSDWDSLKRAIELLTVSLTNINSFPGGLEGLSASLNEQDDESRSQLRLLLRQGDIDRQVSNTMLRMNLARLSALNAIMTSSQDVNTYQSTQGLPEDTPQRISHRV